jgi:hypothetical protein
MTPLPPDNSIAAMLLLTSLAIGLVLLVEFFAR